MGADSEENPVVVLEAAGAKAEGPRSVAEENAAKAGLLSVKAEGLHFAKEESAAHSQAGRLKAVRAQIGRQVQSAALFQASLLAKADLNEEKEE